MYARFKIWVWIIMRMALWTALNMLLYKMSDCQEDWRVDANFSENTKNFCSS